MIQVFKIINGIDRMDPDVFFTPSNTVSTRGHHLKLFKHRTNKDVRKFSFSQRIINDWNRLPNSVVSYRSLNLFKKSLDDHWLRHRFSLPPTSLN